MIDLYMNKQFIIYNSYNMQLINNNLISKLSRQESICTFCTVWTKHNDQISNVQNNFLQLTVLMLFSFFDVLYIYTFELGESLVYCRQKYIVTRETYSSKSALNVLIPGLVTLGLKFHDKNITAGCRGLGVRHDLDVGYHSV